MLRALTSWRCTQLLHMQMDCKGMGGVGNGARDGGEQWNTTAGSRWKESAFSRATERTRSLIAHSPPSDNCDPCQEQLKHHVEQIKGCSVFPPPVCISFVAAFKSFSSMKQFFEWLNAWLQLISNNTLYFMCPKLLSLLLQMKDHRSAHFSLKILLQYALFV